MSPDPDFDHSADTWLDGTSTEAEALVLQDILAQQPAASRDFALLTRAHAALELGSLTLDDRKRRISRMLDKRRPSALLRFRKLRLLWASAAAVIVAGVLISLVNQSPNLEKSPAFTSASKATTLLKKESPQTPLAKLDPPDAAFLTLMDSFIIPEFQANGLSLEDAILLLTGKVQDAGHSQFVVNIDEPPAPGKNEAIHLNLKFQTASTLLHLIAIQSGLTASASGQTWHLRRSPEGPVGQPAPLIVTLERWNSFLQSQGLAAPVPTLTFDTISNNPTSRASSTNQPHAPDPKEVSRIIQTALHSVPHNLEISSPPSPRSTATGIKITSNAGLHAMLERVLAGPSAPGTFSFDFKWVTVPDKATLTQLLQNQSAPSSSNNQISDGILPQLMTSLITDTRMKLETAPPLDLAPGTTLTTLDTSSDDEAIQAGTWTGRWTRITSRPSGSGILCEMLLRNQTLAADGNLTKEEQSFSLALSPGMTLILDAAKHAGGESILFLTSRPSATIPFGIKTPNNPGFVWSPWAIGRGFVDVGGIPQGTKVKCPYTGAVFRVPEP